VFSCLQQLLTAPISGVECMSGMVLSGGLLMTRCDRCDTTITFWLGCAGICRVAGIAKCAMFTMLLLHPALSALSFTLL
jgi:hypothetical protein